MVNQGLYMNALIQVNRLNKIMCKVLTKSAGLWQLHSAFSHVYFSLFVLPRPTHKILDSVLLSLSKEKNCWIMFFIRAVREKNKKNQGTIFYLKVCLHLGLTL